MVGPQDCAGRDVDVPRRRGRLPPKFPNLVTVRLGPLMPKRGLCLCEGHAG